MKIISNNGGVFATNSYLIADETTGKAVIFDAPDHTTVPLLDEAVKNGWEVIGLWLTHGHIDHIADHAFVTGRFPNAKVLIHHLDQPKLHHPNSMYPVPFHTPARSADAFLEDDQRLKIGTIDVTVMHTPGHSPGHVGFYMPNENVLVGGDLIIMGAVGRTDFPDCSYPDLQKSIRRIMKLPPQTHLLPGHGQPSTLNEEAMGKSLRPRSNRPLNESMGTRAGQRNHPERSMYSCEVEGSGSELERPLVSHDSTTLEARSFDSGEYASAQELSGGACLPLRLFDFAVGWFRL